MRIAILYSPWCLSFRKTLDLDTWRTDPRGLSGSELCAIRLVQEMRAAGHEVWLFSNGNGCEPWAQRGDWEGDVAISINYPDELREMRAKLRVCYQLVNSFDYCKRGFFEHVDQWLSPSYSHMQKMLETQDVEMLEDGPAEQWTPNPAQWAVVPLGCDPERYEGFEKVSGRVVYCSSPDRGLHWLLQEWPAIRRAVPHATLRVFYRLKDWIAGFEGTPYFPPIEGLRARALYVEDAIRRLQGHGVEVFDSVSRERIEQEMAQAEVLAYPCDTVRWSEGFSCTVLEACAAGAVPVITDCDALGTIYGGQGCLVSPVGNWGGWRLNVIACLEDPIAAQRIGEKARRFARKHTWKTTSQRIVQIAQNRLSSQSESSTATPPA